MVNKIEWAACTLGIVGAFTVALNATFSGYGFIPFLLGALGYCYVALTHRNIALFLLNLTFALANILGIFKWIIL